MNYETNIGRRVNKPKSGKPFKSGFLINTVKGVINHPILNIPAYTFEEDDSYVECRRCGVIATAIALTASNEHTEYQQKLMKLITDNPNSIIITAEQELGKNKS
ncbi:MAG: hypothetical protein PF487_08310 [Bacteroidales bacterium]|jgi:hypothetical protein|nr:hypothetical protein [Bacteroidales bacterium]